MKVGRDFCHRPSGGGHRKSCIALVSALTLSSEGSPIMEDSRSISWERID